MASPKAAILKQSIAQTQSPIKKFGLTLLALLRLGAFIAVFISCLFSILLSLSLLPFFFSTRASLNRLRVTQKRILRIHMQAILQICGIETILLTNGLYQLKNTDKNLLLLCNHISYLDAIVLAAINPGVFLCKEDVKSWPGIGQLIQIIGSLFVNRDCTHSKVKALFKIKKAINEDIVCVFPQGTTTNLNFSVQGNWERGQVWSAKITKSRICVIGLSYQNHETIAWVDKMTFFPHFLKLLMLPQTKACLSFKFLPEKTYLLPTEAISRQTKSEITDLLQRNQKYFERNQLA